MGRKSRSKRGPVDPKVMYRFNIFAFMPRYFPVFMGSIFMVIFSLSTATSQVSYTWFRHIEATGEYQAMFLIGASVVLTFGGFMITRGRAWAVWILVSLLVLSLLAVLPTWSARAQTATKVIYFLGLLFPLLGLLLLNSQRAREMREQYRLLREYRAESQQRLKRHKALEQHRMKLRERRKK